MYSTYNHHFQSPRGKKDGTDGSVTARGSRIGCNESPEPPPPQRRNVMTQRYRNVLLCKEKDPPPIDYKMTEGARRHPNDESAEFMATLGSYYTKRGSQTARAGSQTARGASTSRLGEQGEWTGILPLGQSRPRVPLSPTDAKGGAKRATPRKSGSHSDLPTTKKSAAPSKVADVKGRLPDQKKSGAAKKNVKFGQKP